MLKRFFLLSGIGFLAGTFLCQLISILIGGDIQASQVLIERMGSVKAALLIQMLLAGLYGAVNFGSTLIYALERVPMLLAVLLHGSIVILPFIPLSLFLGWSNTLSEALIMTAIQTAAYFVIWVIMLFRCRHETRRLNELQKRSFSDEE